MSVLCHCKYIEEVYADAASLCWQQPALSAYTIKPSLMAKLTCLALFSACWHYLVTFLLCIKPITAFQGATRLSNHPSQGWHRFACCGDALLVNPPNLRDDKDCMCSTQSSHCFLSNPARKQLRVCVCILVLLRSQSISLLAFLLCQCCNRSVHCPGMEFCLLVLSLNAIRPYRALLARYTAAACTAVVRC